MEPMSDPERLKLVGYRLPLHLDAAVKAQARAEDRSASSVVRAILRAHFAAQSQSPARVRRQPARDARPA